MEEILDIVNQNDEVVGKDFRKNIYQNGLPKNRYIRYANIFIFDADGLLLLPLRSSTKNIFPNCYDFSCGEHLFSGETYEQAAKRGAFEELGLKNIKLEFLGKLSPQDGLSGFMYIYKTLLSDKKINFNHEVKSLHWYKIDDVIKMAKKEPSKFKDDLLISLNWYKSKFN
jgi:isopentenyl-diphosphate Delta-isomerase